MSNIIDLPITTRLDLDPNKVLDKAREAGMTGVVVLGYDADEDEYFASSYADGGDVLWLLERCKKMLLEQPDND